MHVRSEQPIEAAHMNALREAARLSVPVVHAARCTLLHMDVVSDSGGVNLDAEIHGTGDIYPVVRLGPAADPLPPGTEFLGIQTVDDIIILGGHCLPQ